MKRYFFVVTGTYLFCFWGFFDHAQLQIGRSKHNFSHIDAQSRIGIGTSNRSITPLPHSVSHNASTRVPAFYRPTTLTDKLRSALKRSSGVRITHQFPTWIVPVDGPLELPYNNDVVARNATYAIYHGGTGSIYLSSGTSSNLKSPKLGNCGIDAARQTEVVASLDRPTIHAADALAVFFDFVDSGYWGHAMENLWPRLTPLLRVEHRNVTVVIPRRSILSPHTQQLADALGVRLARKPPVAPHRFLWMCDLPSYHPELRGDFADWSRRRLVPDAPCGSSIFLSRSHGARNGRNPEDAERIEADLAEAGVQVIDDVGSIPLRRLAQRIGGACNLAGVSGSAMFHMTWMRPGSDVWVIFPRHSGTQYGYLWLHAHSIGLRYHHVLDASQLVRLMTARNPPRIPPPLNISGSIILN
jgi:hypothetical protein